MREMGEFDDWNLNLEWSWVKFGKNDSFQRRGSLEKIWCIYKAAMEDDQYIGSRMIVGEDDRWRR